MCIWKKCFGRKRPCLSVYLTYRGGPLLRQSCLVCLYSLEALSGFEGERVVPGIGRSWGGCLFPHCGEELILLCRKFYEFLFFF